MTDGNWTTIFGVKGLVVGIHEPLPLAGFPPGRIRLRLRAGQFARAYVRPPEGGVREFIVVAVDGEWRPYMQTGANVQKGQ